MPGMTMRRMLTRLHEQGFEDLDASHLSVLLYPGPQGARPSELAARRGMSKQAVNYLLGQLERLGYVERRADPDDRRSKRVALTRRGELAGLTMRDAVREIERDWERQLGRERFAQLRGLLLELNQPGYLRGVTQSRVSGSTRPRRPRRPRGRR